MLIDVKNMCIFLLKITICQNAHKKKVGVRAMRAYEGRTSLKWNVLQGRGTLKGLVIKLTNLLGLML